LHSVSARLHTEATADSARHRNPVVRAGIRIDARDGVPISVSQQSQLPRAQPKLFHLLLVDQRRIVAVPIKEFPGRQIADSGKFDESVVASRLRGCRNCLLIQVCERAGQDRARPE